MTVFSLGSANALAIDIDTQGAGIRSLRLRIPTGLLELCLSYPALVAPRADPFYVGTLLGRYAGRIAEGRLQRGPNHWTLANVAGERHCRHGGADGFSARVWQVKEYTPQGGESGARAGASRLQASRLRASRLRASRLVLGLHSPDGDQGFPGALDAEVLFETLAGTAGSPGAGFAYEVRAICDAPTVVNLSSHAYFNLDGSTQGSTVLEHELMLHAATYTPGDAAGIPSGVIAPVAGTPFDFRQWRRVGEVIGDGGALPLGLDQNMIIDGAEGTLRPAAALRSRASGVQMTVATTQPGMQVYSGGYLGSPFKKFAGICLETQNFPDAPHHPAFPEAWLLPGEVYRHRTEFHFTCSSGTVS
ncbi:MAG: galactose mutarotase [Gammaproteobacteria bacterium]|nr:galactose mutarotase [Gammaproteobacteria bacterium]